MSHITRVQSETRDLGALEVAATEVDLRLVRDKTAFKWFSSKDGKCDHVLQHKDHKPGMYEIGVTQQPDGTFSFEYDNWTNQFEKAGGRTNLSGLKQEYSVVVAKRQAEERLARKGFKFHSRELLEGGTVRLRLRAR